MTARSTRLARARDFAVTAAGGASLAIGAVFLTARIMFRNYFALTNRPDPLRVALAFLTISILLGILHTMMPPPLPEEMGGAYKNPGR